MDGGVPNPRSPPLIPASLPLYHRFPSHSTPASLPLEYFSRPHRKKNMSCHQKYNISFQCMDYYQSFKTVGLFVWLFLSSFVSLFLEFYNLVNGPVDSILFRPSRVLGEREKKKEDRIDERKNASIAGSFHTKTQNSKTPWGARWLSGRVSRVRGRAFETYRHRVVSLSKTLYSPKVLVNYPGSVGSVPT